MNIKDYMKITKKFESKLKAYLDKHALRPIIEHNSTEMDISVDEINGSNYDKISECTNDENDIDSTDDIDDLSMDSYKYDDSENDMDIEADYIDENDANNIENESDAWTKYKDKYFFYYKIVSKKKSFFDFTYYDDDDDDDDDDKGKQKDMDKYIQIMIYDIDLAKCLRKITEDGEIFSSRPKIELEYLYSCINDLQIRYNEKKFNKPIVKSLIDFLRDVFQDELKKMENMIKLGKIDYKSLWYYFDKVDTIYKVKLQEKDVCYKHKAFEYFEGDQDRLELIGSIYVTEGTDLKEGRFSHSIPKFKGTKALDSFDISVLSIEDKESILNRSEFALKLSSGYHHMYLKGSLYMIRQQNIVSITCDERSIVDEEGIYKYSSKAFDFITLSKIDRNDLDINQKLLVFPFVSVYTLGSNKTWGMSYIDDVSEIHYQEDAYNYLVLDQSKKDIIKGLVTCHGNSNLTDFIDKKGLGLVFLLYGPPGVGKTLTAEATCEYLQRPMYNISVCDLGTNPETMEAVMERIIEYVRKWKAIILIDEVDIFVEEREYSNVVRNALVSTFLKFLEYNDGIMFLTTNRLQHIDAAIRSRINLFICYEKFERDRRISVWNALLDKWNINLLESTVKTLAQETLNGREIRNYMRLIVSILKDRNQDLVDANIIKVFKECYKLSTEFDNKIIQNTMYS